MPYKSIADRREAAETWDKLHPGPTKERKRRWVQRNKAKVDAYKHQWRVKQRASRDALG